MLRQRHIIWDLLQLVLFCLAHLFYFIFRKCVNELELPFLTKPQLHWLVEPSARFAL